MAFQIALGIIYAVFGLIAIFLLMAVFAALFTGFLSVLGEMFRSTVRRANRVQNPLLKIPKLATWKILAGFFAIMGIGLLVAFLAEPH